MKTILFEKSSMSCSLWRDACALPGSVLDQVGLLAHEARDGVVAQARTGHARALERVLLVEVAFADGGRAQAGAVDAHGAHLHAACDAKRLFGGTREHGAAQALDAVLC